MEESGQRRPLMYVANHGTDDPTLATLPFLEPWVLEVRR
jgi:hypothetical protein